MSRRFLLLCITVLILLVSTVSAFNGTVDNDQTYTATGNENTYRGYCITMTNDYFLVNVTVDSTMVCDLGQNPDCKIAIWNTSGCAQGTAETVTGNIANHSLDTTSSDTVFFISDNIYLTSGNHYFIGAGALTGAPYYQVAVSAGTGTLPDTRPELIWNTSGFKTSASSSLNLYNVNVFNIQDIGLDNDTMPPGPTPGQSLNLSEVLPATGTEFGISLISINASLNSTYGGNMSVYINGTLNTTIFFGAGKNIIAAANITFPDGHYLFYINATDDYVSVQSTAATFIVDTTNPEINTLVNNFVQDGNQTTTSNYGDQIIISYNFTDNQNVFGYIINLTRYASGIFFLENTSINLPFAQKTETFDISNITSGILRMETTVADGHTDKEITEYKTKLKSNELTYETEEGNTITIYSWGSTKTKTIKKKDRYSFGFEYFFSGDKEYTLTADHKIDYLPYSDYPGHFVIWNEEVRDGNWVDFDSGMDYEVTKIDDYTYNIKVINDKSKKDIWFNSIGSLNTFSQVQNWYRGSYSETHESLVAVGIPTTFELNLTKDPVFIGNINATLVYNGTSRSILKSNSSNSTLFTSTFIPSLQTEQTYNFTWYVLVTQFNGSQYNFTIDGNQTNIFAQLNISFKDEENRSLLPYNFNVFFTSAKQNIQTIINTSGIVGGLLPGEYFIQAEENGFPRRGIFVNITNSSNSITMFMLYDRTGSDYVNFFALDSSLDAVEDLRITFIRQYNLTSQIVSQADTDFAGQARFFLDSKNKYSIILTHDDFATKNISLLPILDTYFLTLDSDTVSQYNSSYANILYSFSPQARVLNDSGPTNFTLSLIDLSSSLEYFGVFIDEHNYSCAPANCLQNVTGSPGGGSATVTVDLNESGTVNVHLFYKKTGEPIQYINGNIRTITRLVSRFVHSFDTISSSFRTNLKSSLATTVLAVFIMVTIVLFAAQLGVAGVGFALVAVFANILVTLMGFINPLVGILNSIVGISLYAISRGRG